MILVASTLRKEAPHGWRNSMTKPPLPQNEAERLETLYHYQILDTPPEKAFDDLTRLAAHLCEMPIALITFINQDRQWFKSKIGVAVTETDRETAFCAHSLLQPDPFIIYDASADARFSDNPWVASDPHVRFYAGAPLRTSRGHALGAVCVMDYVPRTLRPQQIEGLQTIANETMTLLDLRRNISELSRRGTLLGQAEEQARFFNLSLDLLFVAGLDGFIRQINPAFERVCGSTKEALQSKPLTDFIHPDDRDRTAAELEKLKAGCKTRSFEVRILQSDGSYRWILWSATPLTEKGLIYAVGHDITDRYQAQKEIKNLNESLERRVDERTTQLNAANRGLEKEIAQRREAEQTLRESEEKYRLLFISNPQPMWVFDSETLAFLAVNDAAVKHYGYSREDFFSMTIKDIRPPEDIPPLLEDFKKMSPGVSRAGVWRHRKKDGTILYVEITRDLIPFSGKPAGIVLAHDVTERKRAEEEHARLLIREQEARTAAERAQRRFTFLAEASEIFSASLDYETTLSSVARLTIPFLADACTVDIVEEDQSIRRVAAAATDPSTEALGWELMRRYPPVREGVHPLQRVLTSGKPVILFEIPDTLLEAIARDPEHLKIARSLGVQSAMIVPLSARGKTLGAISFISIESGRHYGEEDLSLAEDLARRAAIAVDNARLYQAAQQEIHERKQAEEALRRSEAKNRTLLDAIPDMMFQIRRDGAYLDFKPAKEMAPVFSPEILLSKRVQEVLPAEVARQAMEHIRGALETGSPQLFEYSLSAEGLSRDYEARIIVSGEDQVLAIVREITERKRAEEALRKSEERFQLATRATNDAIWDWDLMTDALWWNEGFKTMFGYKDEEIEPRVAWWRDRIHPEDKERVLSGIQATIDRREQFWSDEYRFRRGDGSYAALLDRGYVLHDPSGKPVRMIGAVMDITERKRAEEALAAEKERLTVTLRSIGDGVITTDVEERIILMNKVAENLTGWTQEEAIGRHLDEVFHVIDEKTGRPLENPAVKVLQTGATVALTNHTLLVSRDGTERIIADSGAPIRDKTGHILGVVLVFRDITQKQKMEEDLLRTSKLEAVGLLAGGIAHDFNNILTAILGNLSLVKMSINPNDPLHRRVNDAETASLRARDLAQQLLTFAKGGAPIKKTVSIKRVLEESIPFALRGSNVRAEFFLSDNLWPVEIDEGQISQVLHNLVLNAQQATPKGGIIEVRADNYLATEREKRLPLPAGRYIKITVRDFGIGIPKDHFQKIFDPYFTTKQKGSGLGLPTSYSIIKKHNGYMTVDSELGKGSTFSLYLPASYHDIEPERRPEAPLRGQGKVLIMDDEEAVREVAGEILNFLGYQVEYAEDGNEALERYQKAMASGQPFDLVIMDLTIPGKMGGKEAMERLLEMDPQVKAIVSSGYSNDPIMGDYTKYGFKGIIAKPYQLEQLSKTVHDVIAGPG